MNAPRPVTGQGLNAFQQAAVGRAREAAAATSAALAVKNGFTGDPDTSPGMAAAWAFGTAQARLIALLEIIDDLTGEAPDPDTERLLAAGLAEDRRRAEEQQDRWEATDPGYTPDGAS